MKIIFLILVVGSSIVCGSVVDDILWFIENLDDPEGPQTKEWKGYIDEHDRLYVNLTVVFEKCCQGILFLYLLLLSSRSFLPCSP